MIMKVTRKQIVEGKEYLSDSFYEGKYIRAGLTEAGMIFDVEKSTTSGACIELPHSGENDTYEVYLMENGRTFQHYNF